MQQFPTLKKLNFTIDGAGNAINFKFTNKRPFLLIDIIAPEVSAARIDAIRRANTTTYEQAVAKFFGGQFMYDVREFHPAEPRQVKYLDQIEGVGSVQPKYLLTLIILEIE
jgi:hypothetical protein